MLAEVSEEMVGMVLVETDVSISLSNASFKPITVLWVRGKGGEAVNYA